MKDNFSLHSADYSKFRPSYPVEMYEFIMSFVQERTAAWDCGTGNGQVAIELAKYFSVVYGTDISENQISHAAKKKNIIYKAEPAEQTTFPENFFDLIISAQAIHWFNFDKFYAEVKRTARPDCIFVAAGYGLIQVDQDTDLIIKKLYHDILGTHWDLERKYVDEHYAHIPFPFREIYAPIFSNIYKWDSKQFLGYLNTWSAVKHFIKQYGTNPLDLIRSELNFIWPAGKIKVVEFPVFVRIGTV